MKTWIKDLFLLPVLIAGLGLILAGRVAAQTFTTLHRFTGSDGASPFAELILSGNTLYGTTRNGGSPGNGTVFKVQTNGTSFATLYNFTAVPNSDGAVPDTSLILSGTRLYGTAPQGGSSGHGTVFAVNTDGTGFTNLYGFAGGGDGGNPAARLVLAGNILYGTARGEMVSCCGTVFAVHSDGTDFTTLYSFAGGSDGVGPSGLILSSNTLYGVADAGGSSGAGTVFKVHTNGTGFTNLHHFSYSDGAYPYGALILSGNTLYGTTTAGGGISGAGTVFSLSLGSVTVPQLTMIRSGTNVILTWPTNAAGFTLQSTTNFVSTAVWTTVSPEPVVVNGQNAVTNPISGSLKFYRLRE